MSTTNKPKFAIASLSLGNCQFHTLPSKLEVASCLGYDGVEIFMPDFEAFLSEVRAGQHLQHFPNQPLPASDEAFERECAKAITKLAHGLHLELPLLQPLRNFENFRTDEELKAGLDDAERWIKLMPYFGCDLLLVCSNYVPGEPLSEDYTLEMYMDAQVHAFKALGELAARYCVRVGYEPLAWGTVVSTWHQVWDVVRRVDMPNVGVILDSFNTLYVLTFPSFLHFLITSTAETSMRILGRRRLFVRARRVRQWSRTWSGWRVRYPGRRSSYTSSPTLSSPPLPSLTAQMRLDG